MQLLNARTREGRNDKVRRYHMNLDDSVKDSLVYRHGSAQYKDKRLEEFFNLINKRPVHLPIHFAGGDDNKFLAQAAGDLFDAVFNKALQYKNTGEHLASVTTYIREVGGQAQIEVLTGRVTESMLPDRAVVSVVAKTDYANTLEVTQQGGILYHVARQFRKRYGQQLAVKYDYVSGKKLGLGGGTFPRIQIAHYGNLRPSLKRPGRSRRRRT
ncbi:MAG: hypothetical protein QNJ71_10225 [Acidimicrobiia bacterium]|nr:hypothetical protein [Acidimicrobiia bacterium]